MTIEASLERIAAALELLNDSRGLVNEPKYVLAEEVQTELDLPPADDEDLSAFDDDDLEDDLDVEEWVRILKQEAPPPPAAKKKTKKKVAKKAPAKKKATKVTQVGSDDTATADGIDPDAVRGKLKDLQLKTGSAAEPKSVLKAFGASTFGQLPEAKYAAAIAAVDKKLAEYE